MSDLRLLHGTLALARDPGSALGLRLLPPGTEAGSDLVVSADGLPEAALTLRAFAGRSERDGYAAALAETGGNVFSWIEGPAVAGCPPLLLIARWDRSRAPGEDIDAAVAFVGPEAAPAHAAARSRILAEAERRAEEGRVAASWAAETRVLRADPAAMVTSMEAGTLRYVSTRSGGAFDLLRRPEGIRVAFVVRLHRPSAEEPGWRAAVAARGLDLLPDGRPCTPPGAFGPGASERMDAHAAALEAVAHGLADRANAGAAIDKVIADRNAMRALEALARGNPLLDPARGGTLVQLSPRGGSRQAGGGALHLLVRTGLAEAVLVPPGPGPWRHCPVVYAATASGRALAAGERGPALDAAVAMLRGGTRPAWQPVPGTGFEAGDPADRLAAIGKDLSEADLARLAGVAATVVDGDILPARSDPAAWLAPIAAMVAGLARPDAEGRMRLTEPTPAPAGPGR